MVGPPLKGPVYIDFLLVCSKVFPNGESAPRKRPFKRRFRAITRDAIEVAWNRGRLDVTNQLLGVTLFNERDKPTNGEFISLIAAKAAGD